MFEDKKIYKGVKEPNANALWLHYKDNKLVLESFEPNGWTPINVSEDEIDPLGHTEDYYTFKLGESEDITQRNLEIAAEIGFNNRVNVHIIGTLFGIDYNVEGIYHDGIILTINETFDLDTNTGILDLLYEDDNTTAIELIYGATMSDEDKARNLELLTRMSIYSIFFCRVDYGYGTAQFNTSTGGYATIVTSQGYAVKYTIAADGGVTKDSEINLFAQ